MNQSTSIKSLFAYVRPYRTRAIGGVFLVVGSVLAGVMAPFITRYLIDDLNEGTATTGRILMYALLFLGIALVGGALGLVMRVILLSLAYQVEFDIRERIFAHLTQLDAYFYHRERTGDIMTRMTSDLNAVREFIGQGILQGARTTIGFVLAFGVMFYINVQMAAVMAILLPCISIIFFFLLRIIRRRYEATQEQFSTISNFSQENFAGIRTLRGYAIEARQRGFFRLLNEEYIRLKMSLSRIERPLWPMMSLLFAAGVVALLLVGGRQVVDGKLTLGEFVQFMQYLILLQWPMLALGWTVNLLQRGAGSWRRIEEILSSEPTIRDLDTPSTDTAQPISGELDLQNVNLDMNNVRVLHDIQLHVAPGETIGITGPTGGGKTMLVWLLARLLDPTTGVVRIGGRDARTIPLDALRRAIGMAPQEPFLFSDTLANNIAFGLEETDLERVFAAAEIAQLNQEIETFPDRYDTVLGERGVTLSGGQRQRTAISRAIARSASILILDDVFSAIDTQTEANIQNQLRPLLKERTTIIISHRVSTLRHADRILVLQDGRITQQGTHRELVLEPGYYRELDEVQRLEARLEASS